MFYRDIENRKQLRIARAYPRPGKLEFQRGDIIEQVLGESGRIENETQLMHALRGRLQGSHIRILRDGVALDLNGSKAALPRVLELGVALMLLGYAIGVWTLAGVLRASVAERKGHARSCLAALSLGTLGLAIFLAYLFGAPAECALLAVRIGTFGLLLPIYFTVMHRMLPFFTVK